MSEQFSMNDDFDSLPDIGADYDNNREERLPCILVVDGSGSMREGDAIDALNQGMADLAAELKADPVVAQKVQVKVIRFGQTVDDMGDWADAMYFTPPEIRAHGNTPMGEAVELAMRLAEEQVAHLKSLGIDRKRPWIWLMSDGLPTDSWENVADKARQAQENGKFFLYPVSVINEEGETSHTAALKKFNKDNKCIQIRGAEFARFFKFVSASSAAGSKKEGTDQDVFGLANFGF